MLQNACKTLGFEKNMVYKIPPGGGGGEPYPARGLLGVFRYVESKNQCWQAIKCILHYLICIFPRWPLNFEINQ